MQRDASAGRQPSLACAEVFRRLRVPPPHLSGMDAEQMESRGLDPLMSVDELAEYLGVPVRTVYDWRTTGRPSPG